MQVMPKPPGQQAPRDSAEVVTPLLAASLLSAVGSLPLHLAPLIVATLIADSRSSVAAAGWVPSIMLLGQLSTAVALPALRMHHVRRVPAIVAVVILLIGLGISSSHGFSGILLGWFLAGQCCGVLMYLGALAASQFSRRTLAFSLRLAIILVLAGAVSALLQATNAFTSYQDLLGRLVLILVPIIACGIVLYRPAGEGRATIGNRNGSTWTAGHFSGLATMFFFFVGLTGFLAYVVQQALVRGIGFDDTVWSLVMMKFAAGIWLLGAVLLDFQKPQSDRLLNYSIALIFAILVVSQSRNVIVFFSGLLIFEIAFNNLSARLQAAVVAARPQFADRWLTGVILLGAAVGPPLNGLAISLGLDNVFVLISVLSALGPVLWQQLGGSGAGH